MKNFLKGLAVVMLAAFMPLQAAHAVRTTLTPVTCPNLNSTISANGADFTFTGGDAANGYDFVSTGKEMVLIYNSDGANAYTATIKSAADELGRTGDITTYSLSAGEYAVFGPFPVLGWRQTTGKMNLDASNNAIKFAIIRLR
ncbi:MAG: hypothetical protein K2Y22_04175 [Candidatus Obscuribacterales bacterium]|nr:hypothetical protein [Candidatus Obscuribacterales bacterium]